MPKITLNGKDMDVAPGTTVIQAAIQAGLTVPHYCWHPALPVAASCRICQVEVLGPGPRRTATACNLECADGMSVLTDTPAVAKARAGNLEMLLLNHPLDCPICDKAGECWLQDYTYDYGAGVGRNEFERRKSEKRKPISDKVLLDQERCILCTRCVRFMDSYAKKPELVVTARGEHSVIDIFPDAPVTSDYQGNLADICPVGALTLSNFRFKNRVWWFKGTDSVCTLCSKGCSVTLDVRKNEINRVRPRTNEQNNGWFICDVGRFELEDEFAPKERLTQVMVDGKPSDVATAGARVASALTRCAEAGGDVLVLASTQTTNEDLFALSELFGKANGTLARRTTLAFRKVEEHGPDGILRTGQNAANVAGLRALGFAELSDAELAKRFASGKVRAAWILDSRFTTLASDVDFLAVFVTGSPLADCAHVVVPAQTVGEKDGTLTNAEGLTQRVRAALRAPQGVPGDLAALSAVADGLGVTGMPKSAGDAFVAWSDRAGGQRLALSELPQDGIRIAPMARETKS